MFVSATLLLIRSLNSSKPEVESDSFIDMVGLIECSSCMDCEI